MDKVKQNVPEDEVVDTMNEASEPDIHGPIGIEIGVIATMIATGYSGHVERTYSIMDRDVVVTFDIPKENN